MPRNDAPQTALWNRRIVVEDQLQVLHAHRVLQEGRNDGLQDGPKRKVWQSPTDRDGLEARVLVESNLAVEFFVNDLDQGLDISLGTEFAFFKAQPEIYQRILFQLILDGLEICMLTIFCVGNT